MGVVGVVDCSFIYQSLNRSLSRCERDGVVELVLSNYLSGEKVTIRFEKSSRSVLVFNDRDYLAYVGSLDEDVFQELLKSVSSVKGVSDFNRIRDKVVEVQSMMDKKIDEEYRNLVKSINKLSVKSGVLKLLRNKERVLEILREYVFDTRSLEELNNIEEYANV